MRSVIGGRALSRTVGWGLLLLGVVGQAVGRLLEGSTTHGLDGLARVLNATGLSVLVVGALLVVVGGWLYGRPDPSSARRAAQVGVPVLAGFGIAVGSLAIVGGGATSGAATTPTTAHSHDAAADSSTRSTEPVSTTVLLPGANAEQTAVAAQITTSGTHEHGVAVPEKPMDAASRAELGNQLVQARQAALQYPTVADAEAAGYKMVTPYLPLIGAHYIRWDLMDGTFDLSHPEMLLYDGTAPTSRIVGLSYYLFSDKEPDVFAGPNDHWHQHIGLCLKDNVVIGAESMSATTCTSLGGTKAEAANGWMIHAWVVPGWESPEGVFSPEHPGLT